MVQPLWKTAGQFLPKVNVLFACDPTTVLLGVRPKELRTMSTRTPAGGCSQQLYLNCHNWETTKMPFSSRMGRPAVVYPHDGLFSELPCHGKRRRNLKCTLLSERRQTEKAV